MHLDVQYFSESKLGCHLSDARIVRVGYDTEASAVVQTAWCNELRMIEDIEKLKAKFKPVGI